MIWGKRIVTAAGIVAVLSCAGLAVMAIVALEPGGIAIFDRQFAGYSADTAQEYLASIQAFPEAKALYLGAYRFLDTIFAASLAFALAGIIWLNAKDVHPMGRILLLLAPAVYLVLDMKENAIIAEMLRVGPSVFVATVLAASAYTMFKWTAMLVAILMAIWAWRSAPKSRQEEAL